MSKAFTKEGDGEGPEDFDEPEEDIIPAGTKNYMTPDGYNTLATELNWLLREERPRITEIVSWAAGNGDRSENGDYLYNKKRLREIDRRIRYLTKRTESAEVVDPRRQQGIEQVFFGATVTYDHNGTERTIRIVGIDEARIEQGEVSWISPITRALMKAREGDVVELRTPHGPEQIEVLEIQYQDGDDAR